MRKTSVDRVVAALEQQWTKAKDEHNRMMIGSEARLDALARAIDAAKAEQQRKPRKASKPALVKDEKAS